MQASVFASATGVTGTFHPEAKASALVRPWALWGLGLFIAALWMLIRPNRGVAHDGMIYALFAMARLYPALGHDFFVRYGTQDHFTIFSPLYAQGIRLLGLDHATALGIFVTQLTFFYAAWRLGRRLAAPDMALLGVGCLIFLPSWYGAGMVFSHTEMFLTPRQPAEVFVLLGVSFILDGRRLPAAVCMLLAVLLHPIIAAAGIVFWLVRDLGLPRPLRAAIAFAAFLLTCVIVSLLPHTPLKHFDTEWFTMLRDHLTYLVPTRWALGDWLGAIPGLATLAVGAMRSSPEVRRLSAAALATAAAGLLLAIVGCDLLRVILAAQLQMWRWLWVPGVLGAVLLPLIVADSWQSGALGRAAVLLLIAGWLTSQPSLVLATAVLAPLCAFGAGRAGTAREQRVAVLGACGILALALLHVGQDILNLAYSLPAIPVDHSHLATRIAQLRILAGNAPLCTVSMLAVWHLGCSANPRGTLLLAIMGATACAAVIPYSVSTWIQQKYTDADTARFEPWRRIIPPDAEVLWPDAPPVVAWYSLHRANYWSSLQQAGSVFSHEDFAIGVRRQQDVLMKVPYLGGYYTGLISRNPASKPVDKTLADLCGIPDVRYLASWRHLGPTPYPTVMATQLLTGKPAPLYLYHCNHAQH